MKLNNVIIVESVKRTGSTKSKTTYVKNEKLIKFTPDYNEIFGFSTTINNKLYAVSVPSDFCPAFVFSTKYNDKYPIGTISKKDKVSNYLDMSSFWTYLSTTIEIKGIIKNDEIVVHIPSTNKIYEKRYKLYMQEKYKEYKT